ncbi:hypothetical protein MMC11_001970 [Xylographa trunciseda]|nr:hypothetical protein [Xylographa trunciseda]
MSKPQIGEKPIDYILIYGEHSKQLTKYPHFKDVESKEDAFAESAIDSPDNTGVVPLWWERFVSEFDCTDPDAEDTRYTVECLDRLEISNFQNLGADVTTDVRANRIKCVYVRLCVCKECNENARVYGTTLKKSCPTNKSS